MSNKKNLSRRNFLKYTGKSAMLFAAGPMIQDFTNVAALAGSAISPELLDLQSLLGRSTPQLFFAGNDTYKNFKNGFNLRTLSNPQAVLIPTATDLIPKIFEWSEKTGIPLHPRSGGHSYEGHSSGAGVVLDLQKLNNIQIDKTRGLARIQSGAKLFQVAKTLAAQGLMIPAGSCPTVGISGLTLGGGLGLSSRKLGLTCDNLKSLTAFTADGRQVMASLTSEADLFWACRGGGGGNFALVSEFEFKVHAISEVIFFQYRFAQDLANEVIPVWQEFAPFLPNEITANLTMTGSSTGLSDLRITGQYIAKNSSEVLTEDLVKNALLPILRRITPKQPPIISKKSYLDAVKTFAGGETEDKAYFKAASDIAMKPLSAQGIAVLLEKLRHIPYGAVAVLMDSYGGAIRDVKVEDSAFAHREALYSVQYYSQWGNATENTRRTDLVRSLRDTMKPYFSGRAYVNYIDADLADPRKSYFAENTERLMKIKEHYDPRGFFQRNRRT